MDAKRLSYWLQNPMGAPAPPGRLTVYADPQSQGLDSMAVGNDGHILPDLYLNFFSDAYILLNNGNGELHRKGRSKG